MRVLNNGKWEWNLNISRRVHDNVIEEISRLLPILDRFYEVREDFNDGRLWKNKDKLEKF
ncbi:hypothetical protein MKW92_013771 [Papaver armeniacum]|nr:hypothetical protein MKW92_013771 [Papaver armeniacum]